MIPDVSDRDIRALAVFDREAYKVGEYHMGDVYARS